MKRYRLSVVESVCVCLVHTSRFSVYLEHLDFLFRRYRTALSASPDYTGRATRGSLDAALDPAPSRDADERRSGGLRFAARYFDFREFSCRYIYRIVSNIRSPRARYRIDTTVEQGRVASVVGGGAGGSSLRPRSDGIGLLVRRIAIRMARLRPPPIRRL